MRNIHMAAIALFGFLVFVQAPRAEECQLKQIASLDMVENPYGMLLILAGVAEMPRLMMLDTGGYSGVLFEDVADELKLKKRTVSSLVRIYSADGSKLQRYTVLPSLDLGPSRAKNVEFLLTPRDAGMENAIAGLIAPDILRNFDVDLDFAKRKVNLFSQDHCEGKVVYWARSYQTIPMKLSPEGHIRIETTLDDHELDSIFDTGASHSTLSLRIAQRIFGVDTQAANVKRLGDANSPPQYRTSFRNLSLQGLSVPNPTIDLIPDAIHQRAKDDIPDKEQNQPGTEIPHMPQLILGLDVIHQLHVYIAYKERVLYVTAAGAH